MIKKSTELIKRASATIKQLKAENQALKNRMERKKKIATTIKGRKLAEVTEEIIAEVEEKLEEAGVPEEVVAETVEIVEVALDEAREQADGVALPDAGEGDLEGDLGAELLDEAAKTELAELATDDELPEEAKQAALRLIRKCKDKKAFGREVINAVKRLSASGNFGGSIGTTRISKTGSKNLDSALSGLKSFIDKQI